MAKAQTMQQPEMADDNDLLPKPGVFKKIANKIHWFNEPFKHKYTMGALWRLVTFREQEEEAATRLARITERAIFISMTLLALSGGGPGIVPLLQIVWAKVVAVGIGHVAMHAGRAVEGFFNFLDKKVGSGRPTELRAGTTSEESLSGSRPGMKMEPPVGLRKAPLSKEFDANAAKPLHPSTFNPPGASPLKINGMKPPGKV